MTINIVYFKNILLFIDFFYLSDYGGTSLTINI